MASVVTERFPTEASPRNMSLLLVLFVPLVFLRREWRFRAAFLLVLAALLMLGWFSTTHRISRFLVPWLVPLIVVSAGGAAALMMRGRVLRSTACIALLGLAMIEAIGIVKVRAPYEEIQLMTGRVALHEAVSGITHGSNYDHKAILFINNLPSARTLFYGEAQTLYATGHVIAPTVFDENPLDEALKNSATAEELLAWLCEQGVTHLYVNLAELHRLQWSYAFEFDGRRWPGYTTILPEDGRSLALLREVLEKHSRVVYQSEPLTPRPVEKRDLIASFIDVLNNSSQKMPPVAALQFVLEIR